MMSQAFFFFDAVNLAGQRGFILVGLKPECVKSDKECYICKEIFFYTENCPAWTQNQVS